MVDRRQFIAGAGSLLALSRLTASRLWAQDNGQDTAAVASSPEYVEQQHTDALFDDSPRRFAFRATTVDQFEQWQRDFRARLHELLGLTIMQQEVPFEHRAQRVASEKKDGYTQEKWHLWTEPNVPLPIWVLIPDRPAATPMPLVLTPHGHGRPEVYLGEFRNEKEQKSITDGQRDVAVQAVHQGYLCVHPTARGFGPLRRAEDRGRISSCRTAQMHALMFGRTMIGYRVWDIMKILDWIQTQHPINMRNIAITGNSGGGTTSLYAAACDPRITVSVPSSYFCTFQASIGTLRHCECNYVPGLSREGEMDDVAGLIASRPFCAVAGRDDRIFPIQGVREAYGRVEKIYQVAGAPDRCQLYVGGAGHRYYSDGVWPFVTKSFKQLNAAS